ncbi:MAG TPA: LppP/LprE family lipoprotein [Solirubrobacteraceae bacterium]
MSRRTTPLALAAVLAALGGAVLAGCGSGTKTVSVSGSSAPQSGGTGEESSTGAAHTTGATTSTSTSTNAASATTATTRTATAPAFTRGTSTASSAAGAAAVVRAHGYTPNDLSEYRPEQTLRVLVGTRSGSGDGYGQQAFFFVGGRYIGTDTAQPSAAIKVLGQGDTEVTLAYPLYRSHDALCCPSGGLAHVRFQLNNGRLTPLDPIPPANSAAGLSRQ